jgi:hypothetical protein
MGQEEGKKSLFLLFRILKIFFPFYILMIIFIHKIYFKNLYKIHETFRKGISYLRVKIVGVSK